VTFLLTVNGILRKLVTATPKFIYSRVMIILKCFVSTAANKDGKAGGDKGLWDLIILSEGREQETHGGY
jgi:hypothetical protein